MCLGDLAQVHIDDLASFKVLVIEVTDDELAPGDIWQELLLCDLDVLSMTLDQVFLLFLVHVFHLCHPALTYISHNLFFLLTKSVIVIITLLHVMLLMKDVALVTQIVQLAFLVLHLLLHLDGLVFDRFIHYHL